MHTWGEMWCVVVVLLERPDPCIENMNILFLFSIHLSRDLAFFIRSNWGQPWNTRRDVRILPSLCKESTSQERVQGWHSFFRCLVPLGWEHSRAQECRLSGRVSGSSLQPVTINQDCPPQQDWLNGTRVDENKDYWKLFVVSWSSPQWTTATDQ